MGCRAVAREIAGEGATSMELTPIIAGRCAVVLNGSQDEAEKIPDGEPEDIDPCEQANEKPSDASGSDEVDGGEAPDCEQKGLRIGEAEKKATGMDDVTSRSERGWHVTELDAGSRTEFL